MTLAALVLVVGAAGCGGKAQAKVQVRRAQFGVRLSARSFPTTRIRVWHIRPAALPVHDAVRLSATFRLTHIRKLPGTMAIRFPLGRRVPTGYVVSGATREGNGRWTPVLVRVSGEGRYATVRVPHLSDFIFFGINVSQMLRDVKTGVVDGLLGGATSEASPPHCADEAGARTSGYSIASDSGSTVYWCFGIEDGRRLLKVVNNRRYALTISHPGLSVISSGDFHLTAASLARLGSGSQTILAPRDQATFGANLSSGRSGGISTDYDGLSQSLFQLQFGVQTALGVLLRLGLAAHGTTLAAMDTLLKATNCADAIGGTAGDIIAKCFTPRQIIEAFGFKGLAIAPLMIAGPFIDFFRTEFNSLGDLLNGRTHYRVVVRHAMQAPPTTTVAEPPPPTTTAAEPPTTTTTAAVPSSGGFSIGSPFDDNCVIAWPTAPSRTSTAVEMTMTCPHVPEGDYLFTHVIYGDPNADINSSGPWHVVGKVVDVAVSSYGYKELVVEASSVELGTQTP